MAYFELLKQRMNRWLVDPLNPREADEYIGTYHDGSQQCRVRAVVAVDNKELIDFKVLTQGAAYIDPAAVEVDFRAYLNPANSDAVRSLRLSDSGTPRRPLEVIAGEVIENQPQRFLSSVAARIKGLLPGYKK